MKRKAIMTLDDGEGRQFQGTAEDVERYLTTRPGHLVVVDENPTEGMNRAERRAYWSDRRRIERRIRETWPTRAMRHRGP